MAEAAEEMADWTFGQILATGVEAILLAIAIGIASWAGYWARRAAIAGDKTVEEARAATRAADKAVEVASKTAKHQLRAYMLPEKVSFLKNEVGNLEIAVEFKNTGQTPARKVTQMTRCGVGNPAAKGFDYNIPADRVFGDIGPDQTTTGLFYQSDGNDFIGYGALILSGQKVFYTWGRVRYFDIFDREQTTNFRFRWSPEHDDFVACDEGNEAT